MASKPLEPGKDKFQNLNEDITQCLQEWCSGDDKALSRLITQVYEELHQAASYWLRGNSAKHTLPATALVSELYLRFTGLKTAQFDSREQFFAFAGILMRQIIVDYVRSKSSKKRGGDQIHVPLTKTQMVAGLSQPAEKVLAIHEALQTFENIDPRRAKVVELRFFAGFTLEEIATALGVSAITVSRDLAVAKLWLAREMDSDSSDLG